MRRTMAGAERGAPGSNVAASTRREPRGREGLINRPRQFLFWWMTMLALALLPGAVGRAFSSLNVKVSAGEPRWFFGPGVWRNRVARADIFSAEPVENKWWWGWGVHCAPRGWLYNVAGLSGVETALRDGRTFRRGSDDTGVLAAALAGPQARSPR